MVIHCVDFWASPDASATFIDPAADDGVTYVSSWLTSYTAWEPDGNLQVDNERPTLQTDPAGVDTEHYRATWWFEDGQSPPSMADLLMGNAAAYCSWAIWRHTVDDTGSPACNHDQPSDDRGDDSWSDPRVHGRDQVPDPIASKVIE